MSEYTIPYGRNHYCGPAALAYVLRSDPDHAAGLLRKVSGKRSIHGVTNVQLEAVLRLAGIVFAKPAPTQGLDGATARTPLPTLARWYDAAPPGEHIVCITGHYLVIHGHRMFDNRCHLGKPMALCPYLRRRVKAAWRILR
jgi:hypothetical protein